MPALVSGAIDLHIVDVARRGSKEACSRAVLPLVPAERLVFPNLARLSRTSIADAMHQEYEKRVFRE
ncbi:MAG TPA: hypothetical protein VER26_11115 [Xanthobacteraceae bacterium]|jgi:hypothetical protein|nr:hypothetical protein [Xanthobacteraceae bacterium]